MSDDVEIDYEYLAQRALRRVVFDALTLTAELGKAPGRHHFYIEFATRHPRVRMPADLKAAYPDRMTIVLQHQFEDLAVQDEEFSVTLKFKGRPARLSVPFEAVTAFTDPGASYGLRFDVDSGEADPAAEPDSAQDAATDATRAMQVDGGAKVVSLDRFRKK